MEKNERSSVVERGVEGTQRSKKEEGNRIQCTQWQSRVHYG